MTNDNDQGSRSAPPSFAPASSRRPSKASIRDEDRAGGAPSSTPPSFAPRAARAKDAHRARRPVEQAPDAVPAAIPPRAPRGAAGSSTSSPTTRERRTHSPAARAAAPSMPTPEPRTGRATSGRARTAHPHRARNRVIAIVLVLLLALGGCVFGVWNWVDKGLTKESWLSSAPSGSATTWLLLGSDERDGTTGSDDTPGDRTDTILILTKPKNGPCSLISVPRDSLVEVQDALMKINAVMQVYGKQELVTQIEDITGQKIDHVVKITFGGLTGVVDALGGVELCYDQDVDDELSDLHWKAGCHVADGKTALAFSRMRYSDPKGDFGRADRQRQVIGAIARKGASRSTLLDPGKVRAVGDAALDAITVDDRTNPKTLLDMLMAFRDATGSDGITGSLYWTDPGYYVDGVGSSVLLDSARNIQLFKELADGSHAPGVVGSSAEMG